MAQAQDSIESLTCYYNGQLLAFNSASTPTPTPTPATTANGIPLKGCYEKYSTGASAGTLDVTIQSCSANCALNASNNPGVAIACYFNGSQI